MQLNNEHNKKHLRGSLSAKNGIKNLSVETNKIGVDEQGRDLYLVVSYTTQGFDKHVKEFELTHDLEGAKSRLKGAGKTEEKTEKMPLEFQENQMPQNKI